MKKFVVYYVSSLLIFALLILRAKVMPSYQMTQIEGAVWIGVSFLLLVLSIAHLINRFWKTSANN